MAKYKLLAEHVTSDGQVLPAGTEVGDGTPYSWPMEPSNQMEGLDEDGKAKVDAFWQSRYGHPYQAPDVNPNLSDADKAALEAEEKAKVDAQKAIEAGPPVSEAQKLEREGKPPEPAPEPNPTSQASPTRGGVRHSPGPATKE